MFLFSFAISCARRRQRRRQHRHRKLLWCVLHFVTMRFLPIWRYCSYCCCCPFSFPIRFLYCFCNFSLKTILPTRKMHAMTKCIRVAGKTNKWFIETMNEQLLSSSSSLSLNEDQWENVDVPIVKHMAVLHTLDTPFYLFLLGPAGFVSTTLPREIQNTKNRNWMRHASIASIHYYLKKISNVSRTK